MRYFFDTEFMENGPSQPIWLLSIGVVAEDGREFYAENDGAPLTAANEWVREHVLPYLHGPRMSRPEIQAGIAGLVGNDPRPEFWGYFADYDWVALCQVFGTMMDLPKGWPMFALDLQQIAWVRGVPRERFVPIKAEREHDALSDARWHRDLYPFLMAQRESP